MVYIEQSAGEHEMKFEAVPVHGIQVEAGSA